MPHKALLRLGVHQVHAVLLLAVTVAFSYTHMGSLLRDQACSFRARAVHLQIELSGRCLLHHTLLQQMLLIVTHINEAAMLLIISSAVEYQ